MRRNINPLELNRQLTPFDKMSKVIEKISYDRRAYESVNDWSPILDSH